MERSLQAIPATLTGGREHYPVYVELWTIASVIDARATREGRLWISGMELLPLDPRSDFELRFADGTVERIGVTGWSLEPNSSEFVTSFRFLHKQNLVSLEDFP